jgi:hypothetical protein
MAQFNFNPLLGWADQHRSQLAGLGAGLLSGQPGAGVQAGIQADDAYATQQKAEAERQKQIADQQALRAKYADFFTKQGKPEIAQAISDGITEPGQAYWDFITPKAPIKASEGDVFLDPTTYQPMSTVPKQPDPYTLGEGQVRYGPDNKPLATGPASTPDTLVTNNIGGTDKFYDTLDAKMAEQTASMLDTGLNAQSNNIRLGQIETLLKSAPQGAQGVLTQAAGALGLPVEGASEVQAAQALINQMVPGQRPPGSGTMSDADLALFKASLPAIVNQPGGNGLIIQTAKAINEYYIAQAEIAQRVANREISPAEGRKLQAQVPNPLANFNVKGGGTSAPVIDLGNGITMQEIP